MNVVDSSAWIAFFKGSANGAVFKPVIEQRQRLVVPSICLYEVHKVLSRSLPEALVTQCLDVMRKGRVLDLTDARAITASQMAVRHKLAMADAAIYAMAREFDATLWTQDVDYEGLEGVRYVGKNPSIDK